MKNIISISALLFALLFGSQAEAAGLRPSDMTASGAIVGTQLVWCPTSTPVDFKCTFTQVATFMYSLMSGDCTATSGGAVVCLKTNGVAFSALATTIPGTGVATFLTTPSSANLAAALTDETGTGAAVFGTAPTISSLNASVAMTLAFLTGSTQCLHVNTSGLVSGTGSDCGSGSGAVLSVTGGIGVTVSPTTGAVVVSSSVTQRNNTTTTDTLLSTDSSTVITESNASPVAVGIAVASTTGFTSGNYWTVKNKGAGLVTITPTTSQIDGAASITVKQNQSVDFYSDGTNYWTLPGRPTNVACADVTGATCTIASGTAALGTSAIASQACASVVQGTATGTLTTDRVKASFNGDPTAVTGYIPVTTGALTIYVYPTSGFANFKVCNLTSASITPGAITLNWDVQR